MFFFGKKKSSNIKFNQNLSCASPVIPHEETDAQTGMAEPRVAFLNFVNAPKE
jgi:hypothetical protein